MIPVKLALERACAYIVNIYGFSQLSNLLVEEVELSEDGKYWLITVGFNRPKVPTTTLAEFLSSDDGSPQRERVYKVVKINAETGDAISMKIRDL